MVYISSITFRLSDRDIANIVRASQVNNEQLGITGMLLYNNGSFMQLIEGEDEKVEGLFDKIRRDNRHKDVTLLIKENITHKNFDKWLMGYRNLDALKKLEPELLTPFMDEDLNFSIYKKNPYRALHFLEMFKKIVA